jgi:hypothetical protein
MLKPEEIVEGEEVFNISNNWKNGVFYRSVLDIGRIVRVNKTSVRIDWGRPGITTISMATANLYHIRHKDRIEKSADYRIAFGEVLADVERAVSFLKDSPGTDKIETLKKVLETLESIGGKDETNG